MEDSLRRSAGSGYSGDPPDGDPRHAAAGHGWAPSLSTESRSQLSGQGSPPRPRQRHFEDFVYAHADNLGGQPDFMQPEPNPPRGKGIDQTQAFRLDRDDGWRCLSCHSPSFVACKGTWRCTICDFPEFYNVNQPTRRAVPEGTWVYMPHGQPQPQGPPVTGKGNPQNLHQHPGPGDPEASQNEGERGESEAITEDIIIDPDTNQPIATRRSRRRRRGKGQPDPPLERQHQQDQALPTLAAAAASSGISRKHSTDDWNSLKGPVPGIKYRGGQPPVPPAWHYDKNDINAFSKWKRKVDIWMLQVCSYVPRKEAGILLFSSLRGELEEELEHMSVDDIFHPEGVQNIMSVIRQAVEARTVHVKRKLLHDYEHVARFPQESMRSYTNRYRRVERALEAINIRVTAMYDAEARGSRLLDRSKLPLDAQRNVLIGTAQSLDFDKVKDVLLFQYPEHRAPAPVYGSDRPPHHAGKGSGGSKGHYFKGNHKGKSSDKGYHSKERPGYKGNHNNNQTWVTNATIAEEQPYLQDYQEQDHDETFDLQAEAEVFDEPEQAEAEADQDQDDFGDETDPDIAEVLTVTAKRLSSIVKARGFKNGSRSIEERKRTSHCASCGEQGHWQGDAVCKTSAGSKGGPKGGKPSDGNQSKGKRPARSFKDDAKAAHTVHFVDHHFGYQAEDEDDGEPQGPFTSHQTFMVYTTPSKFDVFLTDTSKLAGYMILDTACQRTCAGIAWANAQRTKLKQFGLAPIEITRHETFEFGSGQPIVSDTLMYLPSLLDNHMCLIGTCILPSKIPLLASRPLMASLGTIIDLTNMTAQFTKINVTVPLCIMNGHIAVQISEFGQQPRCTKQLRDQHGQYQHDVVSGYVSGEVYSLQHQAHMAAQPPGLSEPINSSLAHAPTAPATTSMALAVETSYQEGDGVETTGREVPSWTQPSGIEHFSDACSHGKSEPGDRRAHRHDRLSPGERLPPGHHHGQLHTSTHQEIGESARQLRRLHAVRPEVEMEPGYERMGTLRRGIAFLTVATAFLSNCLGQFVGGANINPTTFGADSSSDIPHYDIGGWEPLTGRLRQAAQVYKIETQVYDKLPPQINASRVDIMELYAGQAEISYRAHQYDLKACQPVDLLYGQDMLDPAQRRQWRETQWRLRPLTLIAAMECTHWSIFNENLNYRGKHRLDDLQRLRQQQEPLVDFAIDGAFDQIEMGNYFLLENPARSRIWELPRMQELAARDDVFIVQGHSGAYGGVNSQGLMIKKTFQWMTNSRDIADAVSRKLDETQLQYCTPLQGADVRQSAVYPANLVKAILRAIKQEAQRRTPTRFLVPKQVFHQEPVRDPESWSDALEKVVRVFNATPMKSLTLPDDDPLYQQICLLVPWKIIRIQITRCPVQRRLPRDINYSHRGALIQYQDGTVQVETEALDGLRYPKQKFSKAAAYGIFWFGFGDPEDASAVTRMRLNLGHPTQKELIRMLAWQGINHPVLGVIDQSTLLHQAARLPDFLPETTKDIFKWLWCKPYGFPYNLRIDQGGNFGGAFRTYMEGHGVMLDIIPAETRWRIGLIERRNSILRDTLERVIDSQAVTDTQGFEDALDASVHAMNSFTYSHGRPAYMAVFGQIPRVPGGLLQDNRSLCYKPEQTDNFTRPEILRAEAVKALAEINASAALRRALLRKTATTIRRDLLPGQPTAFWRWQNPRGRTTRKRGGWTMARFLSYDPDLKSAWVHSGTTTMQVAVEQVRAACGFESWTPDKGDIDLLHDAARNIREDMWEDHRAAGHDPEEDSYDFEFPTDTITGTTCSTITATVPCSHTTSETTSTIHGEASSGDDAPPQQKMLNRKEAKALEREIPWRKIMMLPLADIEMYIQSARKEEQGWESWGSVIPLSDRSCFRNKSRVPGKLVAKTRVVALGHLDPDLAVISRDSPTPTRANGNVQNSGIKWTLWAGDVSTAFQGLPDADERPDDLYLLPPQDEITRRAGTFPARLYKVSGNIYGLANAPRTWTREVTRRLLQADFKQHAMDKMLFYKHIGNRLACVVIVYVDDFLMTHSSEFNRQEVIDLFTWGSQKELGIDAPLDFKNKEITLIPNAQGYKVKVTLRKFTDNTPSPSKLGRRKPDEPPTASEKTEAKSINGSLQWLSSQCRPDLSAWTSLNSRNLPVLNEALVYAKSSPDVGLTFNNVPINESTVIIGYADSSWANAEQCASQQGVIVMITSPKCAEANTPATIIDWCSNKSSRVCKSTLAAEASACVKSVDRAYFVGLTFGELLDGVPAHRAVRHLRQLQVTDCKSLYDAIKAQNPRTSEKRTFVDLRSIQEYIDVRSIRWVPTEHQHADALTKCDKALRASFSQWLSCPYVQLTEGQTRRSALTSC
ncbi:unnamed protein product [Effrenium voratum]|nr:unnamed protein product [Effrenium voratum]